MAWLLYCLTARIAPPDEEKYPSSQPLAPRKPVRPDSSVVNCTLDTRNFGHEFSQCQREPMVILIISKGLYIDNTTVKGKIKHYAMKAYGGVDV
jgi:hypothetical protein